MPSHHRWKYFFFTLAHLIQGPRATEWGKSGKEWPVSSDVELEAKCHVKNLALSEENEIISGPFIIERTGGLLILRIVFSTFLNNWIPCKTLLFLFVEFLHIFLLLREKGNHSYSGVPFL